MRQSLLVLALLWVALFALSGCGSGGRDEIAVYFVPEDRFSLYEPHYVPTNYGFFWTKWNSEGEIYKATVLVSSDKITQQERSHLIREELTQSLGLLNDSHKYPDSIFYQKWTSVQRFSTVDKTIIAMMYSKHILPNMTQSQAIEALKAAHSAQEIDYFVEVALDIEYGDAESRVRKWTRDVTIAVHGSPTKADLRALQETVDDINRIIDAVELRIVE